MTTSRSPFAPIWIAALALAGTAALAGGPWFRGSGGHRGGHGGGSWSGPVFGHGVGGPVVRVLPRGYVTSRYLGQAWFYGGGRWYRPWRGGYACFYPPVGLCITALPFGYQTYYYGGMPYYFYEDVYYLPAPAGGYRVVEPPKEGDAPRPAPAPAKPQDAAGDALLIIPMDGQNEEEMQNDRERARRHAQSVSGYRPGAAEAADPAQAKARQAYLAAMRRFLEDRGYSVK